MVTFGKILIFILFLINASCTSITKISPYFSHEANLQSFREPASSEKIESDAFFKGFWQLSNPQVNRMAFSTTEPCAVDQYEENFSISDGRSGIFLYQVVSQGCRLNLQSSDLNLSQDSFLLFFLVPVFGTNRLRLIAENALLGRGGEIAATFYQESLLRNQTSALRRETIWEDRLEMDCKKEEVSHGFWSSKKNCL